jgi:hypothetical protein
MRVGLGSPNRDDAFAGLVERLTVVLELTFVGEPSS